MNIPLKRFNASVLKIGVVTESGYKEVKGKQLFSELRNTHIQDFVIPLQFEREEIRQFLLQRIIKKELKGGNSE